jgi:hypothetical protein
MIGREVLNVRPNSTELPAARPAVLARNFCEATSPTKAQPRLPTGCDVSKGHRMGEAGIGHLRATLKNDQTQAVKMRKFCSGSVFGTKPRMPTTSIVNVQTIAATTTMRRRPNLSVSVMRQIDVTRAIIACKRQRLELSLPSGSLTHNGRDEKRIIEAALSEEQASVGVEE